MKPPAVATWLLKTIGAGSATESLLGDLVEQFQHGKSRAWYWREVLAALALGSWGEVRTHKLLALNATVTGWTLMAVFSAFAWILPDSVGKLVWNWTVEAGLDSVRVGWFRYFIPHLIIWHLGLGLTGWIVAKCHRARPMPMVFAYLSTVLLWNSLLQTTTLSLVLWRLIPLRATPYLGAFFFIHSAPLLFIATPVSILTGALLASAPDDSDIRVSA